MPHQNIQSLRKSETAADQFYEIIKVTGMEEEFLELQWRDGSCECFSISRMSRFKYDPARGCIDFRHEDLLVTITGRGLYPALFRGMKKRRVTWIREADSDMQDHSGNPVFIESILVKPYWCTNEESPSCS